MKQTPYFSHDANAASDPKIVRLIEEGGLEFYGIFWILVETLRMQEPTFTYPVAALPGLARRFNTTAEKIKAVVNGYELFSVSDNGQIFFSQSLIERMALMEQKREKLRIAGSAGGKQKALNIAMLKQGHSNAIANKVKENKGNKSKVKEIKVNTQERDPYFYLSEGINPNQDLVRKWVHWVEFRKSMRKPYKTKEGEAAAYNHLLKLSDSNSLIAIEIIDQSIANEWQGFFPLKTDNNVIQRNGSKPKSQARIAYEKKLMEE